MRRKAGSRAVAALIVPLALLTGSTSANSPRTPEPSGGDALIGRVKDRARPALGTTTTTTAPVPTTTTTTAPVRTATTSVEAATITTVTTAAATTTEAVLGTETKTRPPKKTEGPTPAGTVAVPTSIPADCSRPVERELMAFFATVPDNVTILFPAGKCYGHDGSIRVLDRVGLTFDGNGSTFRALTDGSTYTEDSGNRMNWVVNGGSRITLRNMVIRGVHPKGGVAPEAYVPAKEGQHGIGIGSVQGALVEDVQVYDVYGDFVAVQWDWRLWDDVLAAAPARDVIVRRLHAERNGRQGFFVGHGERVTLEGSFLGDTNQNGVDLEPDVAQHMAKDIRLVGNTFGRTRFSLLSALTGTGQTVGNITFSGNRMDAPGYTCQPAVTIEGGPGSYKAGIVIEDNVLRQTGPAYWRSAFDLRHTRDVTVRRNSVTLDRSGGCADLLPGLWLFDSHSAAVTSNTFTGSQIAVLADALSTGVTDSGNTL